MKTIYRNLVYIVHPHKMENKVQELESMKTKIESLSKTHQIEILKIMKKNPKVIINENKNGVFINLSFLPDVVLADIREYLNFIHDQEDVLQTLETQKNQFKHDYFMDDESEGTYGSMVLGLRPQTCFDTSVSANTLPSLVGDSSPPSSAL